MTHKSVPVLNSPCELINVDPINPLISKCQIKVCYVGEEPNRNRSVITKETAKKMANSLPGSPIVGYYLEDEGDFEEHSRELEIKDGEIRFKDITKPYGFVDLNAKVWFQKFMDDDSMEREYLCTEGYLWTGQYPEAQRVIEQGNNQSMELAEQNLEGHWAKDKNGKQEFFIINEAIISKLCILGQDQEPCFEGSTITKVQFSFEDSFKEQLFSMMNEMKKILNEGGAREMLEQEEKVIDTEEEKVEDATTTEEEVVVEETVATVEETAAEEVVEEVSVEETSETVTTEEGATEVEDGENTEFAEKTCPKCGKPLSECTCEEDKKEEEKNKKYSLDEIPEYVDLQTVYNELKVQYDILQAQYDDVNMQLAELVEFKRVAERKEKEAMIDSFYMLNDEDKKDVIEHIDVYTVDEIEAKLSIICVRNKVNFNLDDDTTTEGQETMTYNLNDGAQNSFVPAWIKALNDTVAQEN